MADDKADAKPEEGDPNVDEYGVTIQKYVATVLVVVPKEGYGEETLRYARSCLYNVHVGTRAVSTFEDDLIKGRLQDEFQVDGLLSDANMDDYAGVIFVAGEGAAELAVNQDALRLAREAMDAGKLVGAWGESLEILSRAGILKKKRVTGPKSLESVLRDAGAKYTSNQVERDGNLVTGYDSSAGMRFGKALASVVAI